MESIRQLKLKGSIIRSRAKWVEEGEKPTNYFLNLENRNLTSKMIPKLQNDNNDLITKQEDILEEVRAFYARLYDESNDISINDIDLTELLSNCNVSKLTSLESEKLEGLITVEEAGQTLRNMKKKSWVRWVYK